MDQTQLDALQTDLSLRAVRYFEQVGSTNDVAAQWAAQGAPDLAVVVADEQTNGRGRAGRHWYTPRGAALAFSVVVYPTSEDKASISRMTALGALAVCDTLKNLYQLPASIKWPNDVLVHDQKVAGILVEAHWNGDQLGDLILGIGINVAPDSVAVARSHEPGLRFPATCLESEVGRRIDRVELLHAVLASFISWRLQLGSVDFLQAWEAYLAYKHEWIQVIPGDSNEPLPTAGEKPSPIREGQIIGLSNDGSLKLRNRSGEMITVQYGEVRIRPVKKTTAEEEAYVRRST